MSLGAISLILLVLLGGVSSFAGRNRELVHRHRYAFGAVLMLLSGALAVTTWLGA